MTETQWAAFDKLPKGLACDPADRKPFALAWFFVTPVNHLCFFEEWPRDNFVRIKTSSRGVKDYVSLIRQVEQGENSHNHPLENVVWRIMDPSFGKNKSPGTGRTLQGDFALEGLWFDCEVDNTIETGHLAVKERLRDPPTLYVTPNCQNLSDAFLRYHHEEFKREEAYRLQEKPSQDFKDFVDCVRYAVMYNPIYFEQNDRPTEGLRNMGLE